MNKIVKEGASLNPERLGTVGVIIRGPVAVLVSALSTMGAGEHEFIAGVRA